ncbi:hypothetical protein ACFQU2_13145 [Siccirubricoccus deserti]
MAGGGARQGGAAAPQPDPALLQGLDALQEAQRRLKQEIWQPKEWLEQERAAAAAEARRIAARAEAEAAGAAITRLERIRRVRPLLAEADEARAWLAANPGAPVLDAALAPRFRAARETRALAMAELESAERQRRGLAEQLGAVVPDGALLAEAEPIARLAEELGAAERAAAGLPRLEAALADAEARIRGLLRQIGADHSPAEAAALLPATPDSVAARGLIGAAEGAATAVAKAAERVAVLRHRLAEAQAALATLPPMARRLGCNGCCGRSARPASRPRPPSPPRPRSRQPGPWWRRRWPARRPGRARRRCCARCPSRRSRPSSGRRRPWRRRRRGGERRPRRGTRRWPMPRMRRAVWRNCRPAPPCRRMARCRGRVGTATRAGG